MIPAGSGRVGKSRAAALQSGHGTCGFEGGPARQWGHRVCRRRCSGPGHLGSSPGIPASTSSRSSRIAISSPVMRPTTWSMRSRSSMFSLIPVKSANGPKCDVPAARVQEQQSTPVGQVSDSSAARRPCPSLCRARPEERADGAGGRLCRCAVSRVTRRCPGRPCLRTRTAESADRCRTRDDPLTSRAPAWEGAQPVRKISDESPLTAAFGGTVKGVGLVGRRLYYIDSYGHAQRDRQAEKARSKKGSGMPGKTAVYVLLAFAVLVVLASIHLPFEPAFRRGVVRDLDPGGGAEARRPAPEREASRAGAVVNAPAVPASSSLDAITRAGCVTGRRDRGTGRARPPGRRRMTSRLVPVAGWDAPRTRPGSGTARPPAGTRRRPDLLPAS
jgi:hypothetical protein